MIGRILRKDLTLLWPLALLVVAIQVAYEWAAYRLGFISGSPVAEQLFRLLVIAWYVGIVALSIGVVQEDAVPGVDQDWLVRPLPRSQLLSAKLAFVLVTVLLPMLVINLAHSLVIGFPLWFSFGTALYKELYVLLCVLVPALALAAMARNMAELFVLLAAAVVLYAACLALGAIVLGSDRCPTCNTSLTWLQHLLQHAEILVGSALILGLQYFLRRTPWSRVAAAVGIFLLVFLQLPWGLAFAIQSRLAAPAQEESQLARFNIQLPSSVRASPSAILHVPLRIEGLTADQFLRADRAKFALLDAHGEVLWQGINAWRGATQLLPDPATGEVLQAVEIPRAALQHLAERAVRLRVEYSLTLLAGANEYRLPALNGSMRSDELGICLTENTRNWVSVRCRKVGGYPVCFSGTVQATDGQHNAPVVHCAEDYRPYIPAPINILTSSGVDLPVRDPYGVAHYAVDPENLEHAWIGLRTYRVVGHVRRTVSTAFGAGPSTDRR